MLVPDPDDAMARVDAIEFVLEEWDDLEEDDEVATWDRRSGRPLLLVRDEDGNVVDADDLDEDGGCGEVIVEVPEEFPRLLAHQVIRQGDQVRIASIEAIRTLVGEWGALLVDDEKMLGHLLLHHHAPEVVVGQDHDEQIAIHARLHAS